MQKSKEIEKELSQTTNRLNELNEMRENLQSNLDNLQTKFIDGKISLDEIQAEQGKINTLDSSIEALEKRQSETAQKLNESRASDRREDLLQKAKTAAIESEKLHDEYFAIRNELHTTIADTAEKLVAKLVEFRSKQREFERIGESIDPNFTKVGTMDGNAAQRSVKNLLSEIDASDRALMISTDSYLNYPALTYGESVVIAERLAGELAYRKQQAGYDKN